MISLPNRQPLALKEPVGCSMLMINFCHFGPDSGSGSIILFNLRPILLMELSWNDHGIYLWINVSGPLRKRTKSVLMMICNGFLQFILKEIFWTKIIELGNLAVEQEIRGLPGADLRKLNSAAPPISIILVQIFFSLN